MKIIRYIFLSLGFLFCGSVYFLTESARFKEWFGNVKPDNGAFGTDRYRYGDLFGFCFVSKFKEYEKTESTFIADTCHQEKNISLLILGDSYIYKFITEKQFCGISRLLICNWDGDNVSFSNESDTKRILIIESTERYIRNRFLYNDPVCQKIQNVKSRIPQHADVIEKWKDYFAPNDIHIEALLFDYGFFTKSKQLKGDINYKWFHRLPAEVAQSTDGNRLFLSETIDDTLSTSSFSLLSNNELEVLVGNMNSIRQQYLLAGFSEVYFSFIPNPVSLIEPRLGKLNLLIERIQNNSQRKFPIINCLELAEKNPENFFRKSDTHWTTEGCNLWVQRVNEILSQHR